MESFNAYELRIQGLDQLSSFAAAPWELFSFSEVRDLARGRGARIAEATEAPRGSLGLNRQNERPGSGRSARSGFRGFR
jgi:hypothetical protein